MPFIKIPFEFVIENDLTDKEETYTDLLSINTNHIVSYGPSKDKKNTLLSLSDGMSISIRMNVDDFEQVLVDIENVFDMSGVCEN